MSNGKQAGDDRKARKPMSTSEITRDLAVKLADSQAVAKDTGPGDPTLSPLDRIACGLSD